MESATTPPIDAAPIDAGPRAKHSSTSRQIRGSSLMLLGRSMSVVVNFAIQVMIVRYLGEAGIWRICLCAIDLYGRADNCDILGLIALSRASCRSTTSGAITTRCSAPSCWF